MKKILLIIIFIFSVCFGQVKTVQDVANEVLDDTNDALQTTSVDTPKINIVEHFAEDTTVNAVSTIDYFDNYMLDENVYRISETFTLGTANDTSLIVFHNDSAGVDKLLKWNIKGLTATTVMIIEGAVFVRSPDALTLHNLDRNSSNTTTMDSVYAVYEDSTLTTSYSDTLFTISFGALQSTQGRMLLADDSLTVFKIITDANTNKVNCNFEILED